VGERALGWRVIVVWECMLEGGKREESLEKLRSALVR
jgi:G:T-mismatch repair DNA endonuclease (very short patch repair protein)